MPSYFDHNASTAIDPSVLDAMLPYLSGPYGNPSSLHRYGRAARHAVEAARGQVARLIAAPPQTVVFTSGGTEANNYALKGVMHAQLGKRLLYGATEHPSVLEAAQHLQALGHSVETIAVSADGLVDGPKALAQWPGAPVALVSLMAANNETGVLQDFSTIRTLCASGGARLHIDATQALGKLPLSFSECGADLMTLSSHKIYGPKGVGALIVRPDVAIAPLMHGGAQEQARRGGTENLAAIVGFGAAAELAQQTLAERSAHALRLREQLERGLADIQGLQIFAQSAVRLPNTCQFALKGWDGEALLMHLDRRGFAVSSGSACASGSGEPSHVLLAMGVPSALAKGAVRVSLGQGNSAAEVAQFLAALKELAGQA